MPLFKDERELVRNWLKPSLEKQGYMVERFVGFDKIHSKLKAEGKLTDEELATDWPAQPEIDLIFWPKTFVGEPTLYASEVKYFRLTSGALYPEIYSGIGEAVAVLGFGFDAVFLWHLFDPEIPEKIVARSKLYLESLITSSGSAINYRARTLPKLATSSGQLNPSIKLIVDFAETFENQQFFSMAFAKPNQMRYQSGGALRRRIMRKGYRVL